jgi:hypothetical protein
MLAYLKSLLFWPNISRFGRLMGTGDLRSLSDDRFESHNWGAFSPILIAADKDPSPHQFYGGVCSGSLSFLHITEDNNRKGKKI